MSQKALIISQAAFNGLNTAVQQWCVNNIKGYNAVRWAEELVHPIDGRIAFAIEDRILNSLSQTNRDNLVELPNDWYRKLQ